MIDSTEDWRRINMLMERLDDPGLSADARVDVRQELVARSLVQIAVSLRLMHDDHL